MDLLINAAAPQMVRPANVTAYSVGDIVANHGTAANVVALAFSATDLTKMPVMLTHLEILTNDTGPSTASAVFEAWLFTSDPALNTGIVNGDNGAFSVKQAGFIGRMSGSFLAMADGGSAILLPVDGEFLIAKPTSLTLYALLKTQTAFTPSAVSTTWDATLRGLQARAYV